LILPETVVPAYIEEAAKPVFTVEQLRSMGAMVNQLTQADQAALDTIAEEQLDEFGQPIDVVQSMGQPMGQMQMQPMGQMNQMQPMSFPQGQNQVINPVGYSQGAPQEQFGGMQLPGAEPTIVQGQLPQQPPSIGFAQGGDGIVAGAAAPGMGGMIVVDTSPMRMAQDGIDPGMAMGGRRPRRNPYQGSFGRGAGMDPMMMQGDEMMPPMPSGGSGGSIRVNKME
jgi:hypothetical protein